MPQVHPPAGQLDKDAQAIGTEVTVKVRDVVRHGVYQLAGGEPIFRVPYDVFKPLGPVQLRGDMIHYLEAGESRSGRTAPGTLGDAHPGERVIIQLPASKAEHEWWLCEVIEVDGIAAD